MLDKLKRGYYEFKEHKFNKDLAEYLADNGQHPQTLFITCSDLRVAPNALTGSKKGKLFIKKEILVTSLHLTQKSQKIIEQHLL